MSQQQNALTAKIFNATVVVTALGYLVALSDFFIFNVTRVASLSDFQLSGDALTHAGLFVSNCQLSGLVIGSYLWGVLGDKFGRKSCLFASILTYSLATLACAFVSSVDLYALARFAAGLGVAGELGVGLTLISEKLIPNRRGYGAALFITVGFFGAILAGQAAQHLTWRHAYLVGGISGFILLFARILVFESGIYAHMAKRTAQRGGLKIIWQTRQLRKYIAAVLLLTPFTFVPQIIWTLSPEIAKAQGITQPISAGLIMSLGFGCAAFGDLGACLVSEKWHSRKKALLVFCLCGLAVFAKYLFWPATSQTGFYIINCLMGTACGAWMVGNTLTTEQFGTNIRATVATTAPNFARALMFPMNLLFAYLKPLYGAQVTVGIIGAIVFACAFWGCLTVDETYGKNIDYEEA